MAEHPQTHRFDVQPTVPGAATGQALVLDEPLSLWGGLDPETGKIIDQHHPQRGVCVAGTILVMAYGRGSSSASSVLAEAVRLGTAPAAFVLQRSDEIVVLGCLVAEEIYGVVTPVVVCGESDFEQISTGNHISIDGVALTHAAP
ncbi:MAG: putative aconitase with swiveling domain [Verrucomicrobiales bacterium]|jgi:predicted aconitase with swiveling domain